MTNKTITLQYEKRLDGREGNYRVLAIRNSAAYLPGNELSSKEVDYLCRGPSYDVTIVPAQVTLDLG